MSLRESVRDLNSNEFRSPPSARHCKRWRNESSIHHSDVGAPYNKTHCSANPMQKHILTWNMKKKEIKQWPSRSTCSTLICSSTAVRREMRCVRLGFVTPCTSLVALLICIICWASSSQRLRSSVGWSGTMPWSGASWINTFGIQILQNALFSSPFPRQRTDIDISEPGEKYPQTYLTAVLLDFMQHLVEILIELFKLKHCSSVSPLEIGVDRHRVRLLNTKTQLYLCGFRTFKKQLH